MANKKKRKVIEIELKAPRVRLLHLVVRKQKNLV